MSKPPVGNGRYTVPTTSNAADSASSGVMVTLAPALLSRAAVSSVRMWVWVSMVRSLAISSPENCLLCRGRERLSAAPERADASPCRGPRLRYKRGPASHDSGPPMTATSPARSKHEPRVEDDALVRGAGRFMDDPRLPNQAYAAFVRSPHAHARVLSVERRGGAQGQGRAGGAHRRGHQGRRHRQRRRAIRRWPAAAAPRWSMPFRPALAGDSVMHVGDPVAMVVAETAGRRAGRRRSGRRRSTRNCRRSIDLDDGDESRTTQLYPDAPGNLCVDWPGPVAERGQRARGRQDHQGKRRMWRACASRNQRMVVASMETRGATGELRRGHRQLHAARLLAERRRACATRPPPIMGVPNEKLRVITEDVGGAFGMKTPCYPEYLALLVAARKIGRPVHWMSTRSEAFITDTQARDTVTEAELALDDKGKFLALAHAPSVQPGRLCRQCRRRHQHQQFRALPARHVPHSEGRCRRSPAISPTRCRSGPIAAPAGRRPITRSSAWSRKPRASPASTRVRLRKKNLIPPSAMPYKTADHNTYDSGDFPGIVDKALELPTTTISTSASASRPSARNCAASAFPACWNMPARCRWKRPRWRSPAATS